MAIQRLFLDWNRPCLTQCVDWLLAGHQATQASFDLATATLVVPSSRAGRRLLELLVEQGRGHALTPPRIVTLGQLPEHLYTSPLPVANDLTLWLLRAEALQQASQAELAPLMPRPPVRDDLLAHLGLAREIQEIADTLAGHCLTFKAVADHCRDQLSDLDECLRWDALAMLEGRCRMLLSLHGLTDRLAARQDALDHDRVQHDGALVLVAVPELPPLHRAMLEALASPVHALVFAPAEEAAGFDAAGALKPERWMDRPCPLTDSHVHLTDKPVDQAYHVARLISEIQPSPTPDHITVGVGDVTLAPMVERVLTHAGIPARLATGRVISQSQPMVVLSQFAGLMSRRTTHELAEVLRCPAVESAVRRLLDAPDLPILTALDRYLQDHLPHALDGHWLGDDEDGSRPVVALVHRALMSMLPEDWGTPRPLSGWRQAISGILQSCFGHRPLDRFNAHDAELIRVIQALAAALDEQADMPAGLSLASQVTLPQAIQLLLVQLGGQLLPPEAGDAAVELLGWLELPLDDAPHLIVTGFNEGRIPQSANHHWLLPDALRGALGLPTNATRYALEAYRLTAILHSRPNVQLIAGRTTDQGDPLVPSRLLLSSDEKKLPVWIRRFYEPDRNDPAQARLRAPLLLTPGRATRFRVPRPRPLDKPITELKVTAFRDYIACPYRFYLRHVLKLRPLDDKAVELDPLAFGNLAHQVLETFAQSDLARSEDPSHIAQALRDELHRAITRHYGREPSPVVRIQEETLAQRLEALAHWQADQMRQGWVIQPTLIEHHLEATLEVDGQPFRVHGKIDRCDLHPTLGSRLLDYKTSDAGRPPHLTHRQADQWIDLQLPLYRTLSQPLDLPQPMTLGYVQLPRDLKKVGLDVADWTDDMLDDAMTQACDIIRRIRHEEFWPPSSTPRADEFAGLCMDGCLDRQSGLAPLPDDDEETSAALDVQEARP